MFIRKNLIRSGFYLKNCLFLPNLDFLLEQQIKLVLTFVNSVITSNITIGNGQSLSIEFEILQNSLTQEEKV